MVFKVGCAHTLAAGLEYLHNGMAWSVSGTKYYRGHQPMPMKLTGLLAQTTIPTELGL